MKRIILLITAIMLVSCAHVVSDKMREDAGVEPPTDRLFSHPGEYVGRTVILGGTIVNSVNAEDGSYIEMLETPLDGRGRPKDTDISRGRFLIFSEDYLETEIFAPGKKLTVAGEVMGSRPGTVGGMNYIYLLIRAKELHIIKASGDSGPRFHLGIGVFHSI